MKCGIYLSRCVRMGDEDVSGCVRKNKSKIGTERVSGYVKMCQDVQVSTYYVCVGMCNDVKWCDMMMW